MTDFFTQSLLDNSISIEFKRIENNEEMSSINLPYTIQYIDKLIEHFEYREDYSKCKTLLDYKNRKINSHSSKFNG